MAIRRFHQRGIVRFDVPDGVIRGAWLSCTHYAPYRRPRPAPSLRKAMPCPTCGFGPRRAWQDERRLLLLELAVRRAASDPTKLRALALVLDQVVGLCDGGHAWTFRAHRTARRVFLREGTVAGLFDDAGHRVKVYGFNPDRHVESPVALSHAQRRSLLTFCGIN